MTLYEADGRNGLKMHKEIMLGDLSKSIMKFSRSGKYLAIIKRFEDEQDDELLVFESEDMMACLGNIEANNPLFSKKLCKDVNGGTNLIQFDIHDKVVAIASATTL